MQHVQTMYMYDHSLCVSPPDYRIVRNMRELKTDVGHARAWVR